MVEQSVAGAGDPAGSLRTVLLSDRDILAEIDSGRIVMEPWESEMLQPSSHLI